MNALQTGLLLALALLLIVAAVGDWRTRTIPNWLNLTIAAGAVPFWMTMQLPVWPGMAIQLGIGVAAFAIFAIFFALGAMGGGDVKLIAALALWLPLGGLVQMLFVMAIAGGVLTLAMLIRHRMTKSEGQPEIPYGIAIAAAGLWVISEPYLNHFA